MDPMGQWYMNVACILDIPLYFLELKGVFFNPSNLMICKGKKHRFVLYFSSVSSSKQPFFCKICVTWMISPNHDLKKNLLRNHQNFENQFIRNFLNLLEKTRTQFRCDHPRFFHPTLLCRVPELPRTTRSTAGTVETSTSRDSR